MLDYTSDTDIAGFQFNHNGCVTSAGGGDAEANGFTISSSTSAVLGFSFTGSVVPAGMGTLVELGGDVSFDCLSNYVFSDSAGDALSFEIISDEDLNETAFVQVIHNSASPTVDVYIDGTLAIEDFTYRSATPVLELGTSFTVGIAPADGEVIATFPFELMDGGEYVVVATGLLDNTDTPFDLVATSTTFGATEGNVGLNVYHGSTDAPAVDVLADGAVLVPNLSYGSFSGYVEVPAADYVVGVAPTGGTSIADFVAPLSELGGGSAVVFASGFLSGDDPAFGLFAALADGTVIELPLNDIVTETASVQVIHNSASPTVDVYIDGTLAIEDFTYRSATPVLELGTSFTVGIAPADGEVIATFPFELMDGGEYVVVATGLLDNTDTPFDLVATSTTFGATEGNVGLNVYHGSTDAPAVDVLADGAVLVPNLSYGSFSGYVEVPAADYVVGVAPTGGTSIADFVAPLSELGGGSAVVFASGFLSGDDPAFGLFAALADGTVIELPLNDIVTETASVQVIHNSASPTVDVYIDGTLAIEDFTYRSATPVLELGTSFTVGIAPADGEVIATFPFELMDGGEYVVVATGLLDNTDTPFDLVATSTTFGATEGNVGLNVYHGSTDAPAVDVLADGAVLVPNLSYGSFSGYVEVPAADYVVGVAPTGGTSIADFVAPLSELGGGSAVVFASGFLSGDDPAFGLFAALADGTVLELLLDENLSNSEVVVNSFDLLGNYPNPFNPSTTIDFSLNSFSDFEINVYDANGRLVENLYSGFKSPGNHKVVWDASGFATGIYIVNMVSGVSSESLIITLVK